MVESTKVTGITKWFDEGKGYGFVVAEGYNRDIFVHRQQLMKSGIQSLKEDDKVIFVVNDGRKGMFATDITKVELK
jgi:CspA family cold shock protein